MSSTVVYAKALYSASVEDLAMVDCFFTAHEIKLVPKYIAYPLLERLYHLGNLPNSHQ